MYKQGNRRESNLETTEIELETRQKYRELNTD